MDSPIVQLMITAGLLAIGFLWLKHTLKPEKDDREQNERLALLEQQLRHSAEQSNRQVGQMQESLRHLQGQMSQSLDNTRKDVGERLDNASRVIQSVHKQLGQLDESSRHIFNLGKDISRLQSALSAPKFRGQMGELFLQDLLSQILPPDHYATQHPFKGGEKVDAVVKLQAGMVPVDAKFPLENFRRLMESEGEENARGRKEFIRDVKKHIDAIASKYIRTDEGTFDFALMYIPAENIYYEVIIRDEDQTGMQLFQYALNKRVIPVSPNSFYAYLQTILLGLRGLRIEQSAREMIDHLTRLGKEFDRFTDAFRLVGKHLDNSSKQYGEAEKRLGKIEDKMSQIQGNTPNAEPLLAARTEDA